jgi:hypothetical protein
MAKSHEAGSDRAVRRNVAGIAGSGWTGAEGCAGVPGKDVGMSHG